MKHKLIHSLLLFALPALSVYFMFGPASSLAGFIVSASSPWYIPTTLLIWLVMTLGLIVLWVKYEQRFGRVQWLSLNNPLHQIRKSSWIFVAIFLLIVGYFAISAATLYVSAILAWGDATPAAVQKVRREAFPLYLFGWSSISSSAFILLVEVFNRLRKGESQNSPLQ